MVSNDDFDGKATHLNCFYMHMIFEQKYPKPAIVHSASYVAGFTGFPDLDMYSTTSPTSTYLSSLFLELKLHTTYRQQRKKKSYFKCT